MIGILNITPYKDRQYSLLNDEITKVTKEYKDSIQIENDNLMDMDILKRLSNIHSNFVIVNFIDDTECLSEFNLPMNEVMRQDITNSMILSLIHDIKEIVHKKVKCKCVQKYYFIIN